MTIKRKIINNKYNKILLYNIAVNYSQINKNNKFILKYIYRKNIETTVN